MDVFKTHAGAAPIFKINTENYLRETGDIAPYTVDGVRNIRHRYAICPACENPIQIIGIFKNTAESGKTPYGRHHKGTVPHLAVYNEADYLSCPYSNRKWTAPKQKRSPDSKAARIALKTLHDQFDRAIYILSKDIDMHISYNFAKTLLKLYIGDSGWLYRTATPYNLPWTLLEASHAFPLFGRLILVQSGLYQAIQSKCPEVLLVQQPNKRFAAVKNRTGQFVDLHFLFRDHRFERDGNTVTESIVFWVTRGHAYDKTGIETIYEKTLVINPRRFPALVNTSDGKAARDSMLLKIADDLIKIK